MTLILVEARGPGAYARLIVDAGPYKLQRGDGIAGLLHGFVGLLSATMLLPYTITGALAGAATGLALGSVITAPISIVYGDASYVSSIISAAAAGASIALEPGSPLTAAPRPVAVILDGGVPTTYILAHLIPDAIGLSLNAPSWSVTGLCPGPRALIPVQVALPESRSLEDFLVIAASTYGGRVQLHEVKVEAAGGRLYTLWVDADYRDTGVALETVALEIIVYKRGDAPAVHDGMPAEDLDKSNALLVIPVEITGCPDYQPPDGIVIPALPGYKLVVPFSYPFSLDELRLGVTVNGVGVEPTTVIKSIHIETPDPVTGYLVIELPWDLYDASKSSIVVVEVKKEGLVRADTKARIYIIAPAGANA